jgi:hypothetical protein
MLYNLKKNKTLFGIIFLGILAFVLPITLLLVRDTQDLRSSATTPDQLESESGVLSSSGVTRQTSSGASGGSYVLFNKSTTTPGTTPPPDQGTSATAKIIVGAKQQVGYDISFDGISSTGTGPYNKTDDKFGIKTYYWNFGDGTPIQSSTYYPMITHKYSSTGNYTITLTVEDYKGGVDTASVQINVGTLPKATVSSGNIAAAVSSLNGQPGIVSIPSGTYTLTSDLTLPAGTILEGAGKENTIIKTNNFEIVTAGDNIKITKIKFQGPNTGYWLVHYGYENLFVDNNEWYGYNYSTGISSTSSSKASAHFTNNYIHDNDIAGGDSYGIQSGRDSYFLAKNNVMERNRHSVAAGGQNNPYVLFNNGYDLIENEFRYDPVNATIDAAIDMHPTGHGRVRIVNNLIENVRYGIGMKDGWGEITGNTFKNIQSWAMKFGCNTHNSNIIEGAGVYNMKVYNNTFTNVGREFWIVYGFNITVNGTTYNQPVCIN